MGGVADCRVAVGFARHPKILKLRRRCGAEGVLALVSLWAWTAESKPSGRLEGMDHDDIELAAGWAGQPGQLVRALLDLHLLDEADGGGDYAIHDWPDHNGWAAGATDRSAQARQAAAARWRRPDAGGNAASNAASMRPACAQHAGRNAGRNAPLPPPLPSPPPSPPPRLPQGEPPPAAGGGGEKNWNHKKIAAKLADLEVRNGRKIANIDAYRRKIEARLRDQGGPGPDEKAALGLVDVDIVTKNKRRLAALEEASQENAEKEYQAWLDNEPLSHLLRGVGVGGGAQNRQNIADLNLGIDDIH